MFGRNTRADRQGVYGILELTAHAFKWLLYRSGRFGCVCSMLWNNIGVVEVCSWRGIYSAGTPMKIEGGCMEKMIVGEVYKLFK